MEHTYQYLFPFEKISRGARILIYGAGDMGHEYLRQIQITGYCRCAAFLDRAYTKCQPSIVPIYPPEKIAELYFDFVVLALKTKIHLKGIVALLKSLGVDEKKIIYAGIRQDVDTFLSVDKCDYDYNKQFAFQLQDNAISMRYGAALGDCIIAKRFFEAVVSLAPDCLVDIYTPYGSVNINAVYRGTNGFCQTIDDAGVLYKSNATKYMLSISLTNLVEVDAYDKEKCYCVSPMFLAFVENMIECIKSYGLHPGIGCDRFLHYQRMAYLGIDCYQAYNQFSDYVKIHDSKVSIPMITKSVWNEQDIQARSYITVNYGNGAAVPGLSGEIAKQWPFEYLQEFVRQFKQKYPDICVVQMGMDTSPKILEADIYCFGKNLETVKWVLKDSLLHVDSEGGLVHLATQLGTKCAVMFGPTLATFFGYRQNINIIAEKCGGCYAMYEDISRCAKGQERPECMRSITPQLVMKRIEGFMRKTQIGEK